MTSKMSSFYDNDRQAVRARLAELRKVPPPSYETLYKMIFACRDEVFRQKMDFAFEGPRRSRIQALCDIAVQIPWVADQELSRQKLSSHNGVISNIFTGLGIIVALGLVCYAVKRYYQVH